MNIVMKKGIIGLTGLLSLAAIASMNVNAAEESWRYQDGELIATAEFEEGTSEDELVEAMGDEGEYDYPWGIDVSEHQKKIDWEKVQQAGCRFAIIRCGYGSDFEDQDDKYWDYNVKECERLGIPYGVYIYSYATDKEHAESEVAHTLRLLKGCNPTLPIYFDMEDDVMIDAVIHEKTTYLELARTYCEGIEAAGYRAGIYSSLNWWNRFLTEPEYEKWDRWVAQWNKKCDYEGNYTLWQYSALSTIDGISGKIDKNYLVNPNEYTDSVFDSVFLFQDVINTDWYAPYIRYTYRNGYMTGKNPSYFGAADSITRCEIVTVLYRMQESPEISFAQKFGDVDDGLFYSIPITWGAQNDVVRGYANGNFGVLDVCTREQLATFLFRYASYIGRDTSGRADLSGFKDAGLVNEYAKEAMQWMVSEEIIKGTGDGYLNPYGTASRAECATMIMRFMTTMAE